MAIPARNQSCGRLAAAVEPGAADPFPESAPGWLPLIPLSRLRSQLALRRILGQLEQRIAGAVDASALRHLDAQCAVAAEWASHVGVGRSSSARQVADRVVPQGKKESRGREWR